jgi:hypothetical protein
LCAALDDSIADCIVVNPLIDTVLANDNDFLALGR